VSALGEFLLMARIKGELPAEAVRLILGLDPDGEKAAGGGG
jgi:hypothetical protein